MQWGALIAWIVTAGGGFVLLVTWLMRVGCASVSEAESGRR